MGADKQIVGELVIRLILETNFREALGTASASTTQAGKDIAAILAEVKRFNAETKSSVAATAASGAAIENQSKQLDRGRNAYRQFLNEQRLSNRLARETTGAITAVAFALSFLDDQEGEANESQKQLSQSLLKGVAVMNAAEFSLFSLGRAAERLPGRFGAIGTQLAAMSGPVGVTLGILTALYSSIQAANQAGALEREGVGKFIDRIRSVTAGDLTFFKGLNKELSTTVDLLDFSSAIKREEQLRRAYSEGYTPENLPPDLRSPDDKTAKLRAESVEELRKEIEKQKVLNEYIKLADQDILSTGNRVQQLTILLDQANTKLKAGTLLDEHGKSLVEQRVAYTRELGNILKTSYEKQAERLAGVEHEYQLGRLTRQDMIEKLQAEMKSADTAERRRGIEAAILKLTKEEEKAAADTAQYWADAAAKAREQFETATKQLSENRQRIEAARIQDATDQKVAAENARYQKELEHLKDLEAKTGDFDEVRYQARIAALNHEAALRQIMLGQELANLRALGDTAEHIGTVLYQSFSGAGSTLLNQMVGVLRIAIKIAETVKLMEMGQVAQGIGGLGIIGSVLSIFGLFDKGGYTGSGTRYQPAGIVHRGEIVFEKPLVDRHGDVLMGLRAAMQRSYAGGGLAGMGTESLRFSAALQDKMLSQLAVTQNGIMGPTGDVNLTPLLHELRTLNEKLDRKTGFPDRVRVDIDNGEMFLRGHETKLSDWRRRKTF